jgi:N-acetylglucosaminyldiphosphoundecaprenol N-acetyl-beta-D-mannosaminyltransferase
MHQANSPSLQCTSPDTDFRALLLGCPIDNLSMDETIEQIERFIHDRVPSHHVAINVRKVVASFQDSALQQVVRQCDLATADGQPIVWVSHLFGKGLKARVTGIDLMEQLMKVAAQKGYRVYFLGARQQVVAKVVQHYERSYPHLQIAGWSNGYWSPDQEQAVVSAIRQSRSDILLVAMVSPKKEFFIHNHRDALQVPFSMGVGGSFDVVAGEVQRAPCWMQRCGLEWFWRFMQEPLRLWQRYLFDALIFSFLIVREFAHRLLIPLKLNPTNHL